MRRGELRYFRDDYLRCGTVHVSSLRSEETLFLQTNLEETFAIVEDTILHANERLSVRYFIFPALATHI